MEPELGYATKLKLHSSSNAVIETLGITILICCGLAFIANILILLFSLIELLRTLNNHGHRLLYLLTLNFVDFMQIIWGIGVATNHVSGSWMYGEVGCYILHLAFAIVTTAPGTLLFALTCDFGSLTCNICGGKQYLKTTGVIYVVLSAGFLSSLPIYINLETFSYGNQIIVCTDVLNSSSRAIYYGLILFLCFLLPLILTLFVLFTSVFQCQTKPVFTAIGCLVLCRFVSWFMHFVYNFVYTIRPDWGYNDTQLVITFFAFSFPFFGMLISQVLYVYLIVGMRRPTPTEYTSNISHEDKETIGL